MESDKTTQITDEVIRLMDLQVEVLKGTLAEMTVSQVHEYAERRDLIGQLCFGTRLVRNPECHRVKAAHGEPARFTTLCRLEEYLYVPPQRTFKIERGQIVR